MILLIRVHCMNAIMILIDDEINFYFILTANIAVKEKMFI